MNILLDTHIFIWWAQEPEQLSASASALLHDPDNTLFLSFASVWEMQIKIGISKMKLRLPLADLFREQQEINGLQLLPIALPHIYALDALPLVHRDPFDRLLIAQSNTESMPLLSADAVFADYGVNLLS